MGIRLGPHLFLEQVLIDKKPWQRKIVLVMQDLEKPLPGALRFK